MKQLIPLALLAVTGCCAYKPTHPIILPHPEHPIVTPLPPVAGHPLPLPPVPTHPIVVPPPAIPTNLPSGGTNDCGILELKKEELRIDRKTVPNGTVRVRRYIETQNVEIPVTLRRESYVIERIPGSGSGGSWGSAEIVCEIPLTIETATPVITSRVYETVRIRKVSETVTNTITSAVRTEKVDVQKTP